MDTLTIFKGIATLLSDYGIPNVTHYVPDGNADFPQVFPTLPDPDFDLAYQRGLDKLPIGLVVLTSRTLDREGQESLHSFISTGTPFSVKDALEQWRPPVSKPLPILADYPALTFLRVMNARSLRQEEMAGYQAYGVMFTIDTNVEGP